MSTFEAGDAVLINGNLVAELEFYSEELNLLRYVTRTPSGQTDTTTAHVTQTTVQHLVSPAVGSDERVRLREGEELDDEVEDEETELILDEIDDELKESE